MNKYSFPALICGFLMALTIPTEAQQQPKKVHRIGYLSARAPVAEASRSEAIQQGLRELGYVEGQNIVTEYRYAEGKFDRLPELAADLVRLNVDIIVVTGGDPDIRAAKHATKTIPIVITGQGSDPVEAGLIESLARPGGNVTGFTSLSRELGGKRLELLKEAVTKVRRVAVLYEPALSTNVREVKEELPVAGRALGLTIQSWEVQTADGFELAFAGIKKDRREGVYVLGGPLINANLKRIAELALRNRLPSVGGPQYVAAGGLMSYAADTSDSFRRVAYYVDRILKGAKPADLPVEQPKKFVMVINLKTAKQIGVTMPQWLLMKADKVIK